MRTQSLRPVFESPGPYAAVLVDVAHDSENGAQEHELRVRAACEQLTEQGATDKVVARVRERLSEQLGRPAPVARLVVATEHDVLSDEVAGFQVDNPVATYDVLPD